MEKKVANDMEATNNGLIWQFPKIRGPQCRAQNTIVLIMGAIKKGTPNFGKPPYRDGLDFCWFCRICARVPQLV